MKNEMPNLMASALSKFARESVTIEELKTNINKFLDDLLNTGNKDIKYKYYLIGSYDGDINVYEPNDASEAISIINQIYKDRESNDYIAFDPIEIRKMWDRLVNNLYFDIMIQLKDGHRITIVKQEIK